MPREPLHQRFTRGAARFATGVAACVAVTVLPAVARAGRPAASRCAVEDAVIDPRLLHDASVFQRRVDTRHRTVVLEAHEVRDPDDSVAYRLVYVVPRGDQVDALNPTLVTRPGERMVLLVRNCLRDARHIAAYMPEDAVPRGSPPPAGPCPQGPCPLGVLAAMPMEKSAALNVHYHGFGVPPVRGKDDVLSTAIAPLGSVTSTRVDAATQRYAFDVPPNQDPGLYWYHPHIHGSAQPHVMMGLTGALLVVRDGPGERDDSRRIDDVVLVVRDRTVRTADALRPVNVARARLASTFRRAAQARAVVIADTQQYDLRSPECRVVATHGRCLPVVFDSSCNDASGGSVRAIPTVNGYPLAGEGVRGPVRVTIADDRVPRWRVLNASANSYVSLRLQRDSTADTAASVPLQVVARDGIPVKSRAGTRDSVWTARRPVLVAPGSRLEFTFPVDRVPPGGSVFLVSAQVFPGCAGDSLPFRVLAHGVRPPTAMRPRVADVTRPASPTKFAALLQSAALAQSLAPDGPAAAAGVTARRFAFSEDGAGFYLTEVSRTDLPGIAPFHFDAQHPDTAQPSMVAITVRPGGTTTEEWTIYNFTRELHAFHIHQTHFAVLDACDPAAVRTACVGPGTRPPAVPWEMDGAGQLRDVVSVPAARYDGNATDPQQAFAAQPGLVRIRLTFTPEHVGRFVYHCHILEHEDKGMMGAVVVTLARDTPPIVHR